MSQVSRCPTCDALQSLETEFARAIMYRRFPRGRWACPFEAQGWHVRAERVMLEIELTASVSLRLMLERELEVLLAGALMLETDVNREEVAA